MIVQKFNLEREYGELIESCTVTKGTLICDMKVRPSSESNLYRIRVSYKASDRYPKVWLLSPALEMVNGSLPHHIYEMDKNMHPRLCVYYPAYNEWNVGMNIATVFIPWVITWLNTYEYWLITGVWYYDESPSRTKGK